MKADYLLYDPVRSLFALSTENLSHCSICIILIGGMCDGPFSLPYALPLHLACSRDQNISLVHPLLKSSYRQFGLYTLNSDAEDIYNLVKLLKDKKIFLLGHSTGCNGIIHLLGKYIHSLSSKDADLLKKSIAGIILQGPVSDYQHLDCLLGRGKINEFLELAERLVEQNKGETIMPLEAFPMTPPVPIMANRYISLINGDDELFSIYEPAQPVHPTIVSVAKEYPIRIFISEKDEFVPKDVKLPSVISYFSPMLSFNPKNSIFVMKSADHFLSAMKTQQLKDEFIDPILDWCNDIGSSQ